ncbi:4Fe-4S ferredoxin [Candidatus Bathyarchaeota archaeon B24-2]|nr:MAG: 4Fe-4S ferredoxin [Candidatus Bathyarchaeota archaeon B24-2]
MDQRIMVVDPGKCTGCRLCELICSFYHYKEFNPLRSRIRVIKFEEKGFDFPVVCQSCEDAPCIRVCPVSAIKKDAKTGGVYVDEELCIGCKLCMIVCPIGAISLDPHSRKIMICDLCGGDPKCVEFCETKALAYVRIDKVGYLKRKTAIKKFEEMADLL